MAVIEMSTSDWENIPGNPRQRNTEKRAKYAVRYHLAKYCKVHAYVYAAIQGGELLCKLDGHVRGFLWSKGLLEAPPSGKVTVILIEVASLQEAKEVYDQLDCRRATKDPSDVVYGATRENKFELVSPLLRSCRFTTQLKIAQTGKHFSGDPYKLVKYWKPHLLALDSLNLSSNYTVLIALMLIAIKRDGLEVAGPFLQALDRDEGTKDSRGSDGVEALHSHIERRRAQGATAGYENLYDILRRGWNGYLVWLDGRRVKTLSGTDRVSDVIVQFGEKKKCLSKTKK